MISFLRRGLVEQPQRNGWLESFVARLLAVGIVVAMGVPFLVLVGETSIRPLAAVGMTFAAVYIVEWVGRWRIRRRERVNS